MNYLNRFSIILMVGFLLSCQQSGSTDDPEKLKTVLNNFFDGIKSKDFEKIKDATTDDFLLYEDGLVWNRDSANMNIKRHIPFKVEYKLSNLKIFVDNRSGDITYFNHADFEFKDSTKKSFDWIESATFRKGKEGIWKMNFLHVTARE